MSLEDEHFLLKYVHTIWTHTIQNMMNIILKLSELAVVMGIMFFWCFIIHEDVSHFLCLLLVHSFRHLLMLRPGRPGVWNAWVISHFIIAFKLNCSYFVFIFLLFYWEKAFFVFFFLFGFLLFFCSNCIALRLVHPIRLYTEAWVI